MKLPPKQRSRYAMSMLGMGVALAMLSGCHKPADDGTTAMPAVATTPDASLPAEPGTMMPPAPASTGDAYGSQAAGNEMSAPASTAMPPPVDSSQDANANGDAATPDNPASPPNDGNG